MGSAAIIPGPATGVDTVVAPVPDRLAVPGGAQGDAVALSSVALASDEFARATLEAAKR